MRADDVLILIPAAGASSRMRGRDKLLEQVENQSLIARSAQIALASGARVVVTLPPGAAGAARQAVLADLPVETLTVANAAEGMAASLRAGARVAGEAKALMILLPDLPDVTYMDLLAMIAAMPGDPSAPVLRASAEDGTPGHPVILPARLIPALATLRGDVGARAVIAAEGVLAFPLHGSRAITDLDTPEAWAEWRSRNPG